MNKPRSNQVEPIYDLEIDWIQPAVSLYLAIDLGKMAY